MPATMTHAELVDYLRELGLISSSQTRITPLTGGVSSDILLVEDGAQKLVLKRSLEKLRVQDDWHCSTARNITECEAIRYASQLFPTNVPRILHADSEHRLFVMEYFGSAYAPWKARLLNGELDLQVAKQIGELLAELHASSWLADEVRLRFDTGSDFFALRVEPYLLTTGERHPALKRIFQDEADRIQDTALALVHGDWSAKNFLVSEERIIILDWEAAWFGDPAFDSAFFLNLIYLKSLLHREKCDQFFDLMRVFRTAYGRRLYPFDSHLERRILRLTLMLLLARIDGKSRVEYITSEVDKNLVRSFTRQALLEDVDNWEAVDRRWRLAIGMR